MLRCSATDGTGSPQVPSALNDRAADIWEPLLVLADLAGGQWPELARRSAEGLTMRAQQYSPIGSLLMDIATIFLFNDVQRLFSRDIAGRVSWDTGAKRALQVRNELKSTTIPGATPSRKHFGPRRRQRFEQ